MTAESNGGTSKLVNKPTFVEYQGYRFLIMDAPTDSVLPVYLELLQKRHVSVVVRACESNYSTDLFFKNNIKVMDLPFPDGDPPPEDVISKWLALLRETFPQTQRHAGAATGSVANSPGSSRKAVAASAAPAASPAAAVSGEDHKSDAMLGVQSSGNNGAAVSTDDEKAAIAVHCVAGLGRAPILVALAFIEAGMEPLDAVELIRSKRRGAFNSRQLKYLRSYKPRSGKGRGCTTM